MLELPAVQDRPALFSTFLMWLLADLFHDLPEVGDLDKPKLVFFFDEAHLLFNDASKDFLDQIDPDRAADPLQGRRRLLRDADARRTCPATCSAQLGNRVQHALRAFTPDDAKALQARPSRTFPKSAYDLGEVLHPARHRRGGRDGAVGARCADAGRVDPAARPESLMAPTDAAAMDAAVKAASPLRRRTARRSTASRPARPSRPASRPVRRRRPRRRLPRRARRRPASQAPAEVCEAQDSTFEKVVESSTFQYAAKYAAREAVRGMFRIGRR